MCVCTNVQMCVGQRLMLGDFPKISQWIRSLLADRVAGSKPQGSSCSRLPRTRIARLAGVYDLSSLLLFFFF